MTTHSPSYELHVRFVGGTLRAVPLRPPPHAATSVSLANEWRFDIKELEEAISPKTRLLVSASPKLCYRRISRFDIGVLGRKHAVSRSTICHANVSRLT